MVNNLRRAKMLLVTAALVLATLVAYALQISSPVDFALLERQVAAGNTADVIKTLNDIPIERNDANDSIIKWAFKNETHINALVLYDVSRRVFVQNKHEGLKWFFVAQMWTDYDGARCKDASARNGLSLLAQRAPEIVQYQQDHFDEKLSAFEDAMKWEAYHHSRASPMWICMRGMEAYQASIGGKALGAGDLVLPEQEWPKIYAKLNYGWARQFTAMRASRLEDGSHLNGTATRAPNETVTVEGEERRLSGQLLDKMGNLIGRSSSDNSLFTLDKVLTSDCYVSQIAWSPDGRFIVGSHDWCTDDRVWDVHTGKIHMLAQTRNPGGGVVFAPHGDQLVTAGREQRQSGMFRAAIWNMNGECEKTIEFNIGDEKGSLTFDIVRYGYDASTIIFPVGINYGNKVLVYNADKGDLRHTLLPKMAKIISMDTHPFKPLVLFAGYKGDTELWNYETGKRLKGFRSQSGDVQALDYSPDGRFFVSGGDNTQATIVSGTLTKLEDKDIIRVWDTQTLTVHHSYGLGEWGHSINDLKYSPDGIFIAAIYGRDLLVLDAHSDEVLLREKSRHILQHLAFSPDGSKLAVSFDKKIEIFTFQK